MGISCPEGTSGLATNIGLSSSSSQWHRNEASMKLIRDYLRNKAFGDGWESIYYGVIDAIEFAAVRPILLHDQAPTFRENQLPLICIGDALHVVPPWTGKGGNLALRDAFDVAEWVGRGHALSTGIPLDSLRRLEGQCMTRAAKETDDAKEFPERLQKLHDSLKDVHDVSHLNCGHFASIFCDGCFKKCCCRTAVCCCRPCCNCCCCLKC